MDGRQLLHRLQDEDSWLGKKGIEKREELTEKVERKGIEAEERREKEKEKLLRMEKENMDRTRIGIFDPDPAVIEQNRRRKEEMERIEDEETLDHRVDVFRRTAQDKSWFNWLFKTGEQKQVEQQQQQQQQETKQDKPQSAEGKST